MKGEKLGALLLTVLLLKRRDVFLLVPFIQLHALKLKENCSAGNEAAINFNQGRLTTAELLIFLWNTTGNSLCIYFSISANQHLYNKAIFFIRKKSVQFL